MIKVIRFEEEGKVDSGFRTQLVKALVRFDCDAAARERPGVVVTLASVSGCTHRGYDSSLESADDWFVQSYDDERLPQAVRASEAIGEMALVVEAVLAHRNAMW